MADIWSKRKRSQVMALIRSRGNKDTEVVLLKLLRRNRITGWRRHLPLPGKPDFAFRAQRVLIFVDGCYWHGCKHHCRMPSSNRAFWKRKLEGNMARDRRVSRRLRYLGWRVVRLWEHDLKHEARVLGRIGRALAAGQNKMTKARRTKLQGNPKSPARA